MRIILIGNYLPDRQESMERFALMLQSGFDHAGLACEIWRPVVLFGKWARSAHSGLGKWLGYLDKWVIFPFVLKWRMLSRSLRTSDMRFHVCDHSNAPYLNYLPKGRTGITCHDVLAIRGAMGYADAYCPASGSGKVLQRWILRNLQKARFLAADTQTTLDQLNALTQGNWSGTKDWRVIHIGFNDVFASVEEQKRRTLLQAAGVNPDVPYILCVGSSLARKNRRLLIDMVVALDDQWNGTVCYAGQAIDKGLLDYITVKGLKDRVLSVVKPSHSTLVALYSACEALIFPSFSEGFGWPVIEAQACGAPVIASRLDPMPEVSGGAALHADPYQPQAFADAFLQLQDKEFRDYLIRRGFLNCQRFGPATMIDAYLDMYGIKTAQRLLV